MNLDSVSALRIHIYSNVNYITIEQKRQYNGRFFVICYKNAVDFFTCRLCYSVLYKIFYIFKENYGQLRLPACIMYEDVHFRTEKETKTVKV